MFVGKGATLTKKLLWAVNLLILAYIIVAYDNFTIILSGIAIFVIGMFFMQDGFKQLSGGTLERLLQKFTSNSVSAVTTGFLATSLVQSSTITTLITISFLSAELLTLAQGIGVIFGANLGSSTTAWIVSSLGVDVKISTYAFPMVVFGVVLRFSKSNAGKGFGNVLLGLGFIFLGIAYMKDGFDVIKDSIDLAEYAMEGYAGILVYILVGIIITVVIQSSAATLAIIITALNLDSISYLSALSLAIGANVGTVLTAVLASLASNENGKRVALSHVVFNFITASFITIFIYQSMDFIDYLAPLLGISESNYGMKLALFHSFFSVVGILLLTPFIPVIERFLMKVIKDKAVSTAKPKYLTTSVLNNPDASLVALKKETVNLYQNCHRAMLHSINLHTTNLTKENLSLQLEQELTIIDTNIDEIYEKNLKNLYSEIVHYTSFAQESMFDFQQKEVGELKHAARLIVEVLKDMRGIQKNVNFYLNSQNEDIKREYNVLRREIADMLLDIKHLSTLDSIEEQLDLLKAMHDHVQQSDLLTSEALDKLIREDKIKATMATSYMNDSATVTSMQRKLADVATILFTSKKSEDALMESATDSPAAVAA